MKVRPGDSLCKAIKRGSLNAAKGRKVGRLATAVTRPCTRGHTSELYIRQRVWIV